MSDVPARLPPKIHGPANHCIPPQLFSTGSASPVSMLSSAWDFPLSTNPSTGMRAPGNT